MLVEILRQTSIAGRPARVGDVVDLPELDARYFLANGKARLAEVTDHTPAIEPEPEARKPRQRKPPARI
jgi:hypothetical protein